MEAAAVNLIAGDKPADVYSEIAARYLRKRFFESMLITKYFNFCI